MRTEETTKTARFINSSKILEEEKKIHRDVILGNDPLRNQTHWIKNRGTGFRDISSVAAIYL